MTETEHQRSLLAERYTWRTGVRKALELLERSGIRWGNGALAVDLAASHGYLAVALADRGYRVVAFDSSPIRVREVEVRARHREITASVGDLASGLVPGDEPARVVVCVGDAVTDLESAEAVRALLARIRERLVPGGAVALSWHDLSQTLEGVDRITPVRVDDNAIITRFIEYLPERALVHDVSHLRTPVGWSTTKRAYPKLRLSVSDVKAWMEAVGLSPQRAFVEPMATVVARRNKA